MPPSRVNFWTKWVPARGTLILTNMDEYALQDAADLLGNVGLGLLILGAASLIIIDVADNRAFKQTRVWTKSNRKPGVIVLFTGVALVLIGGLLDTYVSWFLW